MDFTGEAFGLVHRRPRGIFRFNVTGSVYGDYPSRSMYQTTQGIFKGFTRGRSFEVPFKLDIGIDNGTSIWLEVDATLVNPSRRGRNVSISRCLYIALDGGLPPQYNCMLDYYQSVGGGNRYVLNKLPIFAESIEVDENCLAITDNVTVNTDKFNLIMKARMSNLRVTVDPAEVSHRKPARCHFITRVKLPKLDSPGGVDKLVNTIDAKRKRSLEREVRDHVVSLAKRSLDEVVEEVARM